MHGDPDTARRTLLDALTKVDPDLAGITTMKMMAGLETAILEVAFWMAMILGSLALALTVSGLFSGCPISSSSAGPKSACAWRLAPDPRYRDPGGLQSMRPIAVGVVVGGGLAVATAVVLLATPAAEMASTLVHPFDPVAYAVSLGVITATCLTAAFLPARRATRINPIETLRTD